jgi:diaminohydroxyphosphoribosylaminopyrimidine deaminase/5-amino-6-(5-phosphoribosylamino)uracil reductase
MANRFSEADKYYMQYALKLADSVKGKTCPNPAVGAVIVKDKTIVGKGATEACGGLHAEKKALKNAGKLSHKATLYTTMEPCCHFGRTPPCTYTIINAQVKRVVVAVKDPNPLVNGKGIGFLRRNNISVSVGLMRKEAIRLNEDFFWSIKHQIPWITLKLALTLDGRIADKRGGSKWITGKESRTFVHNLRRRHSAVAIGSGTLKKDNPKLTVRHVRGTSPIRIVFSSDKNIGKNNFFKNDTKDIKTVIVSGGGRAGQIEERRSGLIIWYTGSQKAPGNLKTFMKMAYQNGITSILIEGGRKLASSFLEYKLVNRLYLFYGNKILGDGIEGFSFNKGLNIKKCLDLNTVETHRFGNDFMITGIPHWEE